MFRGIVGAAGGEAATGGGSHRGSLGEIDPAVASHPAQQRGRCVSRPTSAGASPELGPVRLSPNLSDDMKDR
jgi:hypothetical protein